MKGNCRGICERQEFKLKYNVRKGMNRLFSTLRPIGVKTFGKGYQLCRKCEKFMQHVQSVFCPCCGYRLSKYMRNRNRTYRKRVKREDIKKGISIKTEIIKNREKWENAILDG